MFRGMLLVIHFLRILAIFSLNLLFNKMALVNFKMIADESEPFSLDLSLFDSSSLISTEDEEINNLLKRRTSISLFNVSTPLESREETRRINRCASHYSIYSDHKKVKYITYTNDNKTEEEQTNEQNKNINVSPAISVKSAQALKETETLQVQISKFKSGKSITPLVVRRKSLQSSLIKKCLFRNSSSALRSGEHNSTKSSLFAADSTCMTIDIEDKSAQNENEVFIDFLVTSDRKIKQNPFLIRDESPVSDKYNNTGDPLISPRHLKTNTSSSKVRNFMCKFLKCPEFLKKGRDNKISPIPNVVVISPRTPENDSGNDSDIPQILLEHFNCNTPNVDKLLKDMSKCAEELSQKLDTFRNVLQTCMNHQNVVNT